MQYDMSTKQETIVQTSTPAAEPGLSRYSITALTEAYALLVLKMHDGLIHNFFLCIYVYSVFFLVALELF